MAMLKNRNLFRSLIDPAIEANSPVLVLTVTSDTGDVPQALSKWIGLPAKDNRGAFDGVRA
ncbi:hypothetical protein [Sphingomonas sp.]|uniref:hypothetical protein n=1 Tax=Sphingomonas sp. TaxID=28214 RepID=UPI003B0024D3